MISGNNTNIQDVKKLINVPFAVIITSIIIIVITINKTDSNGLSALLGGYSGLLFGLLFVVIINLIFLKARYFDMIPIIMVMIVVCLLLYFLSIYFDRIISGNVSSYYLSFSYASLLFLIVQLWMIFKVIYKNNEQMNSKLFSTSEFAWLQLFNIINMVFVIIIGIVLYFYSTQG
jgi:hypothetical protein